MHLIFQNGFRHAEGRAGIPGTVMSGPRFRIRYPPFSVKSLLAAQSQTISEVSTGRTEPVVSSCNVRTDNPRRRTFAEEKTVLSLPLTVIAALTISASPSTPRLSLVSVVGSAGNYDIDCDRRSVCRKPPWMTIPSS